MNFMLTGAWFSATGALKDSFGLCGVHFKSIIDMNLGSFFLEFFLTRLVPAASQVMMEN